MRSAQKSQYSSSSCFKNRPSLLKGKREREMEATESLLAAAFRLIERDRRWLVTARVVSFEIERDRRWLLRG